LAVDEAYQLFKEIYTISDKLKTLKEVGLGYIQLGQSATTLSGGEAQRIKLAKELSRSMTRNALYLLDEPTTGLHWEDIKLLLAVLQKIIDKGNSVVVIEHNMHIIKTADYIIDLGPEGGDAGGRVVAKGTPEEIIKNPNSHTAKYLRSYLT
jgi:excinuclease ABC subunit A